MSDLLRSAMSARLAKLPADLPNLRDEDEDGDGELSDTVGQLPGGIGSGLGPPAVPRLTRKPKAKRPPNPDFAPISASGFFSDALQVVVSARNLDVRVYYTPPDQAGGTVLVCHHGAGYSGLSFACLAKEIAGMTKGECGVLALDARRHGKTKSLPEGSKEDEDLSIDILVDDLVEIISTVFPDASAAPSLLLIGHSMGGSVVTRACPRIQERKFRVTGVAVLDVVEGSAMEALPHMQNLLNSRPDGFDSVENAVEWQPRQSTIHTPRAYLYLPSSHQHQRHPRLDSPSFGEHRCGRRRRIGPASSGSLKNGYLTDKRVGWFSGLSAAFLAARTARLLLLAGTDRLDKPLMIAQMQGKFQMIVAGGGVGHLLHEDNPTHIADILVEFWRRNDTLRLPPKMGGVRIKAVGED
ncbi:unnamed protein product [Mycena citricolor]|uniref:Protein phosphatase methylesterase 1 n=1 Tax=Mycena citricolor TaxID=2018698 RepID=A0AAD2H6Y7_9AGAR|nr:unnamed protein product [Mycena citricolor]